MTSKPNSSIYFFPLISTAMVIVLCVYISVDIVNRFERFKESMHASLLQLDSPSRVSKRSAENNEEDDSLLSLEDGNTEWVYTSTFHRIPETVMFQVCVVLKQFCVLQQKKLRGAPGPRGPDGARGEIGKKGPVGRQGYSGEQGKPGEPGLPGVAGRNGTCNCTTEEMERLLAPDVTSEEGYTSSVEPQSTLTTTEIMDWIESNVTTELPKTPIDSELVSKRRCILEKVGTPVFHSESQFSDVGAWMHDVSPEGSHSLKRWVFDGYVSPVIYEYNTELNLLYQRQSVKYYIDYLAAGTGGIVFNGSFFYHQHQSPYIVRYCMSTGEVRQKKLPYMAFRDCFLQEFSSDGALIWDCNSTSSLDDTLYSVQHNFADFETDENGVWVIYQNVLNNGTLTVVNIDAESMAVLRTIYIQIPKEAPICNMFIMCGVLYGLFSCTEYNSRIEFAYDLFNRTYLNVSVAWRNPFGHTTMLSYNPVDKRLYFFDNGKMLSSPVRVGSIY